MPFQTFKEKLKDTTSPEHKALLSHVCRLAEISRCEIAKNFTLWDDHDRIFRSQRPSDKEDENSIRRGEPKKLIVPLTFSQILTFVAFNVQSITQNRRFFELEPTGTEDNPLEEPLELILERDLRRNQWTTFLIQFFLDIGRFSLAAAEVCYLEEYRYVKVEKTEDVPGAFGAMSTETTSSYQQIPCFVGNRIYPVSPYRFLPDTRLPLTRYQEGEFCGSEDVFSLASLRSQGEGIFNLDKIPKFDEEGYKSRLKRSRVDLGPVDQKTNPSLLGFGADQEKGSGNMVKSGPVVITKMVFDVVPKNFEGATQMENLGVEDFPVRYLVWIANDQTIVRFEEAYYLHCKFPYICGQYLPDQHQTINQGLADVCDQITNLITWLLNTHIASQKNATESKFIVDPSGVDVRTLESRSPYIYLKKNAAQTDVRRYITQFQTTDVTAGVMPEIAALKDLLEGVTGNSAQMQGQYSQGRRSATQDRVVAQGAGARGKTVLGGIWDTTFEPLGKQLIANNRQEMDKDTFLRILGKRVWPTNPASQTPEDPIGQPFTDDEIFALFKADPVTIATSEDFFVFDGTLPSEKAFLAQSLQEILMQVLQNPVVAQVLGYGPPQVRELFNQVYLLRGVTPPRLPAPTSVAMPSPEGNNGGDSGPTPLREIVSIKLPDLSGNERAQALSRIGIKADSDAHEKQLKLENPPPASKSNGSRS